MAIEQNLDVNRHKSSMPATKLAIIGFCATNHEETFEILIVDLLNPKRKTVSRDEEFIRISPTIRVKGLEITDAFCVVASTIYVFESSNNRYIFPRPKSVYSIDLSELDLTNPNPVVLDKTELNEVENMLHPKISPYVTPTPDGKKILLFSYALHFKPSLPRSVTTAGDHDFELYDIDTGLWRRLPGINGQWDYQYRRKCDRDRDRSHHDTCLKIRAFTFVSESIFFIQTESGSMYVLDLDCIDQGWEEWDVFYGGTPVPYKGGRFFVIEDELCLTADGAYDVRETGYAREGYMFPLPSYGIDIDLSGPCSILVVDEVKKGKFEFCTLETGVGTETRRPYVTVGAYRCDLAKYRHDRKKKGDVVPKLKARVEMVECFKFVVDVEECVEFVACDMYSISSAD